MAVAGRTTVLILAGLGGRTGCHFTPLAALLARDGGALTAAVVTLPFTLLEGRVRNEAAAAALLRLAAHCHCTIALHHDSLLPSRGHAMPHAALATANEHQRAVAEAVADLSEGRARLLNEPIAGRELLENAGFGTAIVRACARDDLVPSFPDVLTSVADSPLRKSGGLLILLVRGAETLEQAEIDRCRTLLELRFPGERAILGVTPATGSFDQLTIAAMFFHGPAPAA